jgi:hypothetical protein
MAVRVRLRIEEDAGGVVETTAVLNSGFEIDEPHLLLPAACATRLLGEFRSSPQLEFSVAGGVGRFYAPPTNARAKVVSVERAGPIVSFRLLVSDGDSEVLVSDSGIDALNLRVETFSRGLWRFADEAALRPSEPPQHW